jgi:DNA invertase Pin-like site-specific DNA recombinase
MLRRTLKANPMTNARFQYLAEMQHNGNVNLQIGSKHYIQSMSNKYAYENKSITLKDGSELRISDAHEKGELLNTQYLAMTRVSSSGQTKDQQVNAIENYVRTVIKSYDENGVPIYLNPECVTKGGDILWIHEKKGTSAWSKRRKSCLDNRPIGQFVYDMIQTNKTQLVFISELSRLYRNAAYCGLFREQLKHEWKTDADVFWPRNPFGLRDDMGKQAIAHQMMMDEEESQVKSDRVVNSMEVQRKNGLASTKNTFGWDRFKTGNQTKHKKTEWGLEPNWDEIAIIEHLRNMIENEGASLSKCANQMNDLGIKGKSGGKWWPTTVTKYCYKSKQHDFLDEHPRPLRMPTYPFTNYRKKMGY